MEIGEMAVMGGVRGKILEILETPTEKKVKLELEDGKIAIVSYVRAESDNALGTMRLG